MNDQFQIKWIDRGRPPSQPPNPAFPNGIDVDTGERPACRVELPYDETRRKRMFYVPATATEVPDNVVPFVRPEGNDEGED